MELELKDSVALIVGGASGIGKACVSAFRAEGCRVVIWDIAPSVDEQDSDHAECLHLQVDISCEKSVAEAMQNTLAWAGRNPNRAADSVDGTQRLNEQPQASVEGVFHLVHAAAVGSGRFGFPFTNLVPSDWERVLSVNINGMVNVAHAVAPVMVAQQKGTMVFVASVAGQIGSPTDPPYSASKAANINFAQVMAKDLAGSGIRVNTVCPGMVKTPLNRSVWKSWNERQPEDQRKTYDDWAQEKIHQLVPLGTWQLPEDVADMIVFLSSARAAQVTGQTINVDGGYVMHW